MRMKLRLDRAAPAPLHEQLRDQIQAALHLGELRPGDGLPSLREMARRHGINPKTVLRAYRALTEQGLLEVRPGSGAVVGGEAIERREEERAVRLLHLARRHQVEAEEAGLTAREHRQLLERLDPDAAATGAALTRVRVVVLECNSEQARVFAREISRRLPAQAFPLVLPAREESAASLLRMADLWVTTDFHAVEVRRRASEQGRPCLSLRLDPRFTRAVVEAAQRGPLVMVYADLAVFPPFLRALRNAGADERLVSRIRGVAADDRGQLEREISRVTSVYVSPLCEEIARRVPRRLLVRAPRWYIATRSIEALRAMILALPTFSRESSPGPLRGR